MCPICGHSESVHRTIKIIDQGISCPILVICLGCGKVCGDVTAGRWRRIVAIEIDEGIEREE